MNVFERLWAALFPQPEPEPEPEPSEKDLRYLRYMERAQADFFENDYRERKQGLAAGNWRDDEGNIRDRNGQPFIRITRKLN